MLAPKPGAGAAADPIGAVASASELCAAVLAELNAVRADPAAYVAKLEVMLPCFDGENVYRPADGATPFRTHEGAAAVTSAIEALGAAAAASDDAPLKRCARVRRELCIIQRLLVARARE